MFYLRDKVVYPGHGVAEVSRIIEKNIGGTTTKFFELKFMGSDMTILIPITNMQGVRKLSSKEDIDKLYELLSENGKLKASINASSWSKRNKQYQSEISSGDLNKITEIYKYLKLVSYKKDLSFGEKHLLQQAETLLAQEIAVVKEIEEEKVINSLRSFFNSNIEDHSVRASIKTKM